MSMLKNSLSFVFATFIGFGAIAQSTSISLQPDATAGKDAVVLLKDASDNFGNSNYGTNTGMVAARWTTSSIWYKERGYIQFDFSTIPDNAIIVSANLTFYGTAHNPLNRPNTCYLKKVLSPWTETGLTWNNQPTTFSETDPISFGPSTSSTQNFTLNVKNHVQSMVNYKNLNYGWVLMLQDEASTTYTLFQAASSDYATASKRPKLDIVYELPMNITGGVTHATGLGNANGSITLNVSGGVAPYTYSWGPGQTQNFINNQLPGLYTCTVTDANGIQQKKYFMIGAIGSPVTVNIQPDALQGKDASIMLNDNGTTYLYNNFGTAVKTEATRWTSSGWYKVRSLLQFDLSTIPIDAYVNAATLNLYGQTHTTNNNVSYLSRISTAWEENLVSWNNQPIVESGDRLTLNASSGASQNYSLDVSTHARVMVANPTGNKGWELTLANEAAGSIQSMQFASSDNTTAAQRPMLSITFTIAQSCDDTRNWTLSRTYGENGEITGESKVFMDYLGRSTQAQSRVLSDNSILATQTLYDGFGRAIGQTLPAPTNQASLCYKTNFSTNAGGTNYSYNDFDKPITTNNLAGETNNPAPFGNSTAGTVGYYYSDNNSAEPFVAASAFPYSRVEYYSDPIGRVKKSAGVGADHKMGSGHESKVYYMCNGGELDYMFGFHGTYEKDDNFAQRNDKNENLHLIKTVSINPDGKEIISYSNSSGQPIASCLSGVSSSCVAQKISQPVRFSLNGFTEIHLPKSKNNTLKFPKAYNGETSGNPTSTAIIGLLMYGDWSNGADFRKLGYIIQDVNSGKILQAGASAGTGDYYFDPSTRQVTFNAPYNNTSLFLRIAYTVYNPVSSGIYYNPQMYPGGGAYLNKDFAPNLMLEYETDYSNWSLNYYDAKGRAVATVSPNDVNCSGSSLAATSFNTATSNNTHTTSGCLVGYDRGFIDLTQYTLNGQSQDANVSLSLSLYDPQGVFSGARVIGQNQSAIVKRTPSRYGYSWPLDTTLVNIDTTKLRKFFTAQIIEMPRNKAFMPLVYTPFPLKDANGTIIGSQVDSTLSRILGDVQSINYRYTYTLKCDIPGGTYTHPADLPLEFSFLFGNNGINSRVVNGNLNQSVYLPASVVHVATNIHITVKTAEVMLYGYNGIPEDYYNLCDVNPPNVNILPALWSDVKFNYPGFIQLSTKAVIANYNLLPNHTISSKNYFDNRSRPVASWSNDEGRADIVYDDEDKARFTQNDKQRGINYPYGGMFTYINYDRAARPVESGEYNPTNALPGTKLFFQTHAQNAAGATVPGGCASVFTIVNTNDGVDDARCSQQTYTAYDYPDVSIPTVPGAVTPYTQKNTAAKVSKTWNASSSTWYTYDNMGRLSWALQNINGLGLKTTNYSYNLLGSVLQSVYQQEQSSERFFHHFEYDADQRLKRAYTSFDGVNRTLQDKYDFYTHGALKREEIGGSLQGLDYVYTINGLLKSMNEPALSPAADPGKDSYNNSSNAGFAQDVFGYSIDYYNNDYVRSGTGIQSYNSSIFNGNNNTYSGLIKATRWQTQMPSGAGNNMPGILMYEYNYDSKYQLAEGRFGKAYTNTANSVSNPQNNTAAVFSAYNDYWLQGLTYDNNGNIKTQSRNATLDGEGTLRVLDNLTYNYQAGKANRLVQVSDAVNNGSTYSPQVDLASQSNAANYQYNEIGQLIVNLQEDSYIEYDVYGKVINVYKNSNMAQKLKFEYNDKGLRHKKTVYNTSGTPTDNYWYVYDAAGALISTYHTVISTSVTTQDELLVYAASRIGIYKRAGNKFLYEINDHLGNVRAVISDTKSIGQNVSTFDNSNLDSWSDNGGNRAILSIDNAALKVTIAQGPWPGTAKTFSTQAGKLYAFTSVIDEGNISTPHLTVWDWSLGRASTQVQFSLSEHPMVFTGSGANVNVEINTPIETPGNYFKVDNLALREIYAAQNLYNNDFNTGQTGGWVADNGATITATGNRLKVDVVDKNAGLIGISQTFTTVAGRVYDLSNSLDLNGTSVVRCLVVDGGNNIIEYHQDNNLDKHNSFIATSNQTTIKFYYPGWAPGPNNATFYLDNIALNEMAYKTANYNAEVIAYTDYYPGGSVLPNRQYVSSLGYKYGYQGQEFDAETGLSNFELRQYDARVMRWFAPDPYGQYHSPYLAMGNNPISSVDPDGGYSVSGDPGDNGSYNPGSYMDAGFNNAFEYQKFQHGMDEFRRDDMMGAHFDQVENRAIAMQEWANDGEWKYPQQSKGGAKKNTDPVWVPNPNRVAKPDGGFDRINGWKTAWYAKKYERKYDRFVKRNDNASLSDFIYFNVNQSWFKNYEYYAGSNSTSWDYYRKTTINQNPNIAFKTSKGAGNGTNNSDFDLDVGFNSGYLVLDMSAHSAADRFQIIDPSNGKVIFDTNKKVYGIKTSGEVRFNLQTGTKLRVRVNPGSNFGSSKDGPATVWEYSLFADPTKGIRKKMLTSIDVSNKANPE